MSEPPFVEAHESCSHEWINIIGSTNAAFPYANPHVDNFYPVYSFYEENLEKTFSCKCFVNTINRARIEFAFPLKGRRQHC